MIVLPAIAAIGFGSGALVCWRGVTAESGTSPGGRWRIRWACWRWLAEKKIGIGPWERIGAFNRRQRGLAKTVAMASVAVPQPLSIQAEPAMIRLIRGRREPE